MPQFNNNQNRVVLITGAAKRIGAAIASVMHKQNWNILIHYHQSSDLAANLMHEFNQQRENSAFALQADLTDTSSYAKFIARAVKPWNRLDALVNNAAVFFPTPIKEATIDQWQQLFTTNVIAPYFLTQAALPYLHEHDGSIVNITDTHADSRPLKYYNIYNMTKSALLMQTQSLARDLGPTLRVNAVAPGSGAWEPDAPITSIQEEILKRVPLRRPANPFEIATAVRYLLEDATYTTGSVIYVDGGRCLFN